MMQYEITQRFTGVPARVLLAAYTHPDHQAMQDQHTEIERREILERIDDAAQYRCESRVFPRRQLPAFVRPFVRGGLEYHEVVTWDKATDLLDITVVPALFGGRAQVHAVARVTADGADALRVLNGKVTVEIALLGGRIERAIVAEVTKSMEPAAERTRAWLARQSAQQRNPVE